MSDQPQEKPQIDLHPGNAPGFLCFALKKPKCIVLTQDKDGVIQMTHHGVQDTATLNEMLSVGIYSALREHYEHMRIGVGGDELQERQSKIDEMNKAGVTA